MTMSSLGETRWAGPRSATRGDDRDRRGDRSAWRRVAATTSFEPAAWLTPLRRTDHRRSRVASGAWRRCASLGISRAKRSLAQDGVRTRPEDAVNDRAAL